MSFAKLLSGRVAKVTGSNLSADRSEYIKVSESEPDFGFPLSDNGIFSSRLSGERRFLFPSTGLVVDNLTGNITVDFTAPGNERFANFEVTDTDSGYTWAETGIISPDSSSDTVKFVSGGSINIDADTTNDAIRVSHADTSLLDGTYGTNGIANITVDEYGHVTELTTATFVTSDILQDIVLDSTDADQYITFVENTSGAQTGRVDTDLTYNPSTNLLTVGGNLIVTGDFTVNGITTTINSTTVTIDDPVFTLGGDTAPTIDDNLDRGIEFRWHDGVSAKLGFFGFDDSTGKWTFIPDATNTSEVFSGATGELDAKVDWSNLLNIPPGGGSDTTYSISAESPAANTVLRLTGSDATTDDVEFVGSGGTTVTRTDADTITISSVSTANSFETITVTDTDIGYTWSADGSLTADTTTDTLTFVSGSDIDIDIDPTNDAIRVTYTGVATDLLQDIALDATDAAQYISFVENTTGAQTGRVDADLTYNPSTNILSSSNFTVNGGSISYVSPDTLNTITTSLDNNDTWAITGDSGVLFSVDDAPGGTLLVYDGSSTVVIEVDANGDLILTETTGSVLIGTGTDNGVDKLQVVGSTNITGDLNLGSNIVFEGATADTFETTLTVTDPTADRTVTFQDASGTVAYLSDITGGGSATFSDLNITNSIIFEGATVDDFETTLVVVDPTQDNTVTFQDASGTVALLGTIELGTDTTGNYVATIAGTTNEIEVTGSGSETAAVTIGLPNDVTIGNDLTVTGDLIVNGTTTTVNSTTVTIDDPVFTLGGDTAPTSDDNKDRGIEFRWHDGTADTNAGSFSIGVEYVIISTGTTDFTLIGATDSNPGTVFTATGAGSGTGTALATSAQKLGFFGYDDSTGKWTFIPDATNSSEVFSGTAGTIVAGLLSTIVVIILQL